MIINMTKYCTPKNASIGIKEAIKNCNKGDTIVFDKNEYHFFKDYSIHKVCHMTNTDSFKTPEKYFAILLEDKQDITIDANGSTFIIHGDMCAFAMIRCKNITLKNFTIKYNAPTNFEMTVIEKKGLTIKYSIPENSPFTVKGRRNIIYFEQSPFTKKNYYEYKNNSQCYCNVIHNNDDVYRTILSPIKTAIRIKQTSPTTVECKYIVPPKFKVGDTVAISRNYCRDNSGLFFWECKDISSENITINYMHGFGWLSQMCENLSFEKINFVPAKGYHVSSFADCIHICGCKGYAKINNCLFTHPHDDGINIHGTFLRLKEIIDSKTAVFEFAHHQQGGFSALFKGDKVKFYSRKNLEELQGVYTVSDYQDSIDDKTVTVKFEENLPKMQNKLFVCENITYNPCVTISNCTFKAIPTRGILCTTDKKSQIFSNSFYKLKMPDIYISCDCKEWYESGPCKDLKIYNNKFSQENPIVFEPLCIVAPVENVHENIEIYDNENYTEK